MGKGGRGEGEGLWARYGDADLDDLGEEVCEWKMALVIPSSFFPNDHT